MICSQSAVIDVILNFVALACIAQIDDLYASSLHNFKLVKALDSPPVKLRNSKDIIWKKVSCYRKLIRIIYVVFRAVYISFYYYFTPFITIGITYFVGKTVSNS